MNKGGKVYKKEDTLLFGYDSIPFDKVGLLDTRGGELKVYDLNGKQKGYQEPDSEERIMETVRLRLGEIFSEKGSHEDNFFCLARGVRISRNASKETVDSVLQSMGITDKKIKEFELWKKDRPNFVGGEAITDNDY